MRVDLTWEGWRPHDHAKEGMVETWEMTSQRFGDATVVRWRCCYSDPSIYMDDRRLLHAQFGGPAHAITEACVTEPAETLGSERTGDATTSDPVGTEVLSGAARE